MESITVPVSVDKAGRSVTVDADAWGDGDETMATLSIDGGRDHWTWINAEEARAVADALIQVADELEQRDG